MDGYLVVVGGDIFKLPACALLRLLLVSVCRFPSLTSISVAFPPSLSPSLRDKNRRSKRREGAEYKRMGWHHVFLVVERGGDAGRPSRDVFVAILCTENGEIEGKRSGGSQNFGILLDF